MTDLEFFAINHGSYEHLNLLRYSTLSTFYPIFISVNSSKSISSQTCSIEKPHCYTGWKKFTFVARAPACH